MTYRDDTPITRAVELVRVQEQQRLHARELLIEEACTGADEALRQFAEALAPLPVRLLHEEPGATLPLPATPRTAVDKLVELRIGWPGKARTAGEFYLDINRPAAPWRLILKRPDTLDFKTFEELLVGITERPTFGTNYTEALADGGGASRQIMRWDAGNGRVIEIITTAQTSRRMLVVGWLAAGVLGAGALALLRLLGLPV